MAAEARERMSGGGGGSRSRGATVWRGGRGEMTGGRLHHDIRHSSPPPRPLSLCHSARPRSSVVTSESPRRRRRRRRPLPPARLFLPLAVTPPFEMSLLLPTAGAEAVTTIIVSEVTSLESATGQETRQRQKETKREREREREAKRERERERKGKELKSRRTGERI